jgi:hypothetical protein
MSEPLTVNVLAYIKRAIRTPELRHRAGLYVGAAYANGLLDDQEEKREIRPSSLGSCSLELWAKFHGLTTLERDPIDTWLCRLAVGGFMGAVEAALFKAAAEQDGWRVVLEYEPADGGHLDALCFREGRPPHPVEFKSSWDTGVIPKPDKSNRNHCLQLGEYAGRVAAERMTLVYVKPPAAKGKRMAQFELDAAPWITLARQDRERLQAALGDARPLADPQERFQCFTCGYAACTRNKNRTKDEVDLGLGAVA